MKKSHSFLAASFGPLEKKTFAAALNRFLEDQCPQMGGDLTRRVLVTQIQQLVEEFYPPHTNLRMGQFMWQAGQPSEAKYSRVKGAGVLPSTAFEGGAAAATGDRSNAAS